MKPTRVWVACSMLSLSCAFVACGSDNKVKVVRADEGGAGGRGGEAGEPPAMGGSGQPTSGGAGAGGEPMAGTGGVATVAGASAGGASAGEGGFGGQAPYCFQLEQSVGGAGGAGGAPASMPQGGAGSGPLHFTCNDVTGHFDSTANKIILDQLPGMDPTVSGRLLLRYGGMCHEATITRVGNTFEVPVDPAPAVTDSIVVTTYAVQDACNNDVALDTATGQPGWCWGFWFANPQDNTNWPISCYEGGGTECADPCPPP